MADRPTLKPRSKECDGCHNRFTPAKGKEWHRMCYPCWNKQRQRMSLAPKPDYPPGQVKLTEEEEAFFRWSAEEHKKRLINDFWRFQGAEVAKEKAEIRASQNELKRRAEPPLRVKVQAMIAESRQDLIAQCWVDPVAACRRIRRIAADQRRLWLPQALIRVHCNDRSPR
jgi:hypothetical protein